MQLEIWVKLHEGPSHDISNYGRIRRVAYEIETNCGTGNVTHALRLPDKFMIGKKLTLKGYCRINFGKKVYLVHRLVGKYFLPNPENKPQINHKDGDKINNRADNLEWVTNKENREHAVKHNLHAKGSKLPQSKLTENDIIKIIDLTKQNIPQSAIASLFGVKQQAISKIIRGERWKHVSR